MKKFSLMIGLMICAIAGVSAQSLTFEGNIEPLKNVGTYDVEFDYSELYVENLPVKEFLATKDGKFNNDWESDIVVTAEEVAKLLPAYFNKNLTFNTSSPKYVFVLRLKGLLLGNAGSQFIPFASAKAGGATITGQFDIMDAQTREVIGILHFNNFKGYNSGYDFSDKGRWRMAYLTLVKPVKKLIKKTK